MASLFSLPNELVLSSICTRFPCRDQQIHSLATLLSIQSALPKNLVLYGLEATGKSTITQAILRSLSSHNLNEVPEGDSQDNLLYAIINSTECISGRHLLEQTVGAVAQLVDWKGPVPRCENLSQLVVELGRFLESWTTNTSEDRKQRLVLVFDGIDNQRDAPPTLLPALARLGEVNPIITCVFIVRAPRPVFLHLPGVPHIHFSAYTKAELLQILSLTEPDPKLPGGAKDTKDVWSRFCSAVWDSLAKHSGRDILSMRSVCLRLWPLFIAPILEGTHGTQFSKLLLANRTLFQNENVLVHSLIPDSKPTTTNTTTRYQGIGTQLPFYSRLLLVSAYLASYNAPKTDQLHFMKTSAAKRRKKGGGTALTPNRISKHRKISRKLLGPQAFVLERMLAIFHAIKEDANTRGKRKEETAGAADIQMAIATLASLRLLVKMGSKDAGDALEAGTKWRVAVGWEVVRGVARSVGVEAEDYLAE